MPKLFTLNYLKPRLAGAFVGLVLIASFGASMGRASASSMPALHFPVTTFATFEECKAKGAFFGLVPWYNYMETEVNPANCEVTCFNVFPKTEKNSCGQLKSDIPGILLAIIDDLLRIAGIVAVAFVLVGAFQYVASRGNPERTAQAQSSIINALVGLVVAMTAVGFISFLGGSL